MLLGYDCCRCLIKQTSELFAALPDEKRKWEIFGEMVSHLLRDHDKVFPPVMAEKFFEIMTRETGISDSYMDRKDASTKIGLGLYEKFMNERIDFRMALLLAIGGNVIDFGANPDFNLRDAEREIEAVLKSPYDTKAADDLEMRMNSAKRIFYILDNCGEAVLDRMLMERFHEKITIGVRGIPVLNDITMREVAPSGLGGFPVVDSGIGTPGVDITRARREFVDAMKSSDLVIAKGQGNYESLEESFTARPTYYLLRVKCPVVARKVDVPVGSICIIGKNI